VDPGSQTQDTETSHETAGYF